MREKKLVDLFLENEDLIRRVTSCVLKRKQESSVTGSLDWENIILGLKRTTRDFLETVVDNLSESIIVTDLDGKIVYFNKGSEKIFGYRPEEILGRPSSRSGSSGRMSLRKSAREKRFEGNWSIPVRTVKPARPMSSVSP